MLDKLKQSQNEYLELLKKIRGNLDLEEVAYHLDKIRNFWFRKQKLLEMCSQHLFNNSDAYFYTAVSKFNVDSLDKNILFALGNYQIFDDPLLSYLEIVEKSNTMQHMNDYVIKLKERIIECIDDLIVLLEKEIPNFYVLPLRFSSSVINEEKIDIMPFIENFFIEGIDFKNLHQYEDIDTVVVHEYLPQILLFDYDNPTETIRYRLKQYRIECSDMFPKNMNDAELLRFIIYGYFSQAMDIFLTSYTFNAFPFFSSLTTYLNYNVLLLNIVHYSKKENLEHFLKTSRLTFPIWFEYDKKGVELSVSEIRERAKNINFSDRIREIYNALDDFNTQEQLITEIENCVHLLINYEGRGC
ncbi:Uncharacterised protein [Streptococcus anginosus]|uniref:hypothetical protein n=1 Tax=Streptococcus anginosus TaxID=1328 RepID=UPI000D031AB5|nr:hypothetical protein [Streptococcus anginosus]MCW1035320.1 hypothetical protein [Streptococcus anginosus]PRT75079.1 hypothetical protein C6A24_01850 [Streptococcus anginosus]VTS43566.1 Uncharacterised protein [Streptococcus anginosus]